MVGVTVGVIMIRNVKSTDMDMDMDGAGIMDTEVMVRN